MTTLLLIIQIIIVLALIGIILIQKTGTDSLAGLSGGGHNIFSSKSSTNFLTKATIILTICFITNSIIIAKVINNEHHKSIKLIKSINQDTSTIRKLEAPEITE